MILSNNGNDFKVPGKDLRVSASLSIAKKDLSGDTSSTDKASTGIKPQRLSVSLIIPMKQKPDMKRLKQISIALDDKGDSLVYGIVDDTAEIMDIREVSFVDQVRVQKADGLQAWNVSFVLEEHRSISERREARQAQEEIKATLQDGTVIKGSSPAGSKLQQFMEVGTKALK